MKKGFVKTDWRKSLPRDLFPKNYLPGEKEKEESLLIKEVAPSQRNFRSKAAEEGKRIAPFWMPDDIGTENFDESGGTAYLRKI